MQFYQNKKNHQIKIINGSKGHHYNKRRRLNAAHTNNYLDTVLGLNPVDDSIKNLMRQHHINLELIYNGSYKPLISEHCNQVIYTLGPSSKYEVTKSNQSLLALDKLQYKSIMFHYQTLLRINKNHQQWCKTLSNKTRRTQIMKTIKSNEISLKKDIAQLTKNMELRLQNKPSNFMFTTMLQDVIPYILGEQDNDDGITSDETAGLYINELDDILQCSLDSIICNPAINTVKQFINYMFSRYDIAVKTTDTHGNSLKYWRFLWLNYKKHCPEENIKWISESRDKYPTYTAKNMINAIHTNSVSYIHNEERFRPVMNNHAKMFILFGDYGAGQKYIQKYLKNAFHIKPVHRWTKPTTKSLSLVDYDLEHVLYYVQHYNNIVIPIKVTMPNQRTAFHRLLKEQAPYHVAKLLIHKNKMMHKYNCQIITHSLHVQGNHLYIADKKIATNIADISLTNLIRYVSIIPVNR